MTSSMFRIVRIVSSLFKWYYVKDGRLFLNIWFDWWKLHQISNILKNKMIVIANVYPILQTVKDLVRPFSKKRCLRISFDSQPVRGSQAHVKSAWEHFHHIFLSLGGEIIWKISPSVKFEILGIFVNTLTADDKYPIRELFPSFLFNFLKFHPILKFLKKTWLS